MRFPFRVCEFDCAADKNFAACVARRWRVFLHSNVNREEMQDVSPRAEEEENAESACIRALAFAEIVRRSRVKRSHALKLIARITTDDAILILPDNTRT